MTASGFIRKRQHSERGYVALEFALAMGLLVLPTALILLQIPSYLEQRDRVTAIAATIAQECANKASSQQDGQAIARNTARQEMLASSSLSRSTLISTSCNYETGHLTPGSHVRSNIAISVPAPVILGVPHNFAWTMSGHHDAIIPKYRSVNEAP
ncbi:MAG TPA: hypothetical protein PKB15_06870 [Acidimicrobiia bacterium]|nr:hypothetical protein [Acidimicrobiia bacterium]